MTTSGRATSDTPGDAPAWVVPLRRGRSAVPRGTALQTAFVPLVVLPGAALARGGAASARCAAPRWARRGRRCRHQPAKSRGDAGGPDDCPTSRFRPRRVRRLRRGRQPARRRGTAGCSGTPPPVCPRHRRADGRSPTRRAGGAAWGCAITGVRRLPSTNEWTIRRRAATAHSGCCAVCTPPKQALGPAVPERCRAGPPVTPCRRRSYVFDPKSRSHPPHPAPDTGWTMGHVRVRGDISRTAPA